MSELRKIAVSLAALLIVLSGCKKPAPVEGYRVVKFDAASQQWTLLRNGTWDGKYMLKRLVLVCDFYQWADHPAVDGADACDLRVGEMIIPNSLDVHRKADEPFVDVFEMSGNRLAITTGDGANRVSQQFKIMSAEVLPDSNSQ